MVGGDTMKNIYQAFIQNILNTRGRFNCGDEHHECHHIVLRCMGGTGVWEGFMAAQNGTDINRSHISSCCSGNRQHAGGYRWKILDENYE